MGRATFVEQVCLGALLLSLVTACASAELRNDSRWLDGATTAEASVDARVDDVESAKPDATLLQRDAATAQDAAQMADASREKLLSPPNFDPDNVVGGYFLMPQSTEGLYTRRADGCSRGTKRLIDVLYTAAVRWREARPDLPALEFWDLNEGPCSTVDHATHADGTHADVHVECGTEVSCDDIAPAVTLAKIFLDTGLACGIIFNDSVVQAEVNPFFEANYAYTPWFGTFMRTVGNHVVHFHVRVLPASGDCNN